MGMGSQELLADRVSALGTGKRRTVRNMCPLWHTKVACVHRAQEGLIEGTRLDAVGKY